MSFTNEELRVLKRLAAENLGETAVVRTGAPQGGLRSEGKSAGKEKTPKEIGAGETVDGLTDKLHGITYTVHEEELKGSNPFAYGVWLVVIGGQLTPSDIGALKQCFPVTGAGWQQLEDKVEVNGLRKNFEAKLDKFHRLFPDAICYWLAPSKFLGRFQAVSRVVAALQYSRGSLSANEYKKYLGALPEYKLALALPEIDTTLRRSHRDVDVNDDTTATRAAAAHGPQYSWLRTDDVADDAQPAKRVVKSEPEEVVVAKTKAKTQTAQVFKPALLRNR